MSEPGRKKTTQKELLLFRLKKIINKFKTGDSLTIIFIKKPLINELTILQKEKAQTC